MKKKQDFTGSWQLSRLNNFACKEKEEILFYETCYAKLHKKFSFKILSVMIFFQKEHHLKKPGSLVLLYRIAHSNGDPILDFEKRYEAYYDALKEKGFL